MDESQYLKNTKEVHSNSYSHTLHSSNVSSSSRTPSNIMVKSAYNFYNVKEPNYISETILELYQYISKLNSTDLNVLEIEAKLGFFEFRGACVQGFRELRDPFRLPNYDRNDRNYHNYRYDFNPGLSENQFNTLWYFVNKESERPGSEIIPLEPINYKETHYKSGIRRSVAYKKGIPQNEEIIIKKDKHHINIRNQGRDFRITSCIEEKQLGILIDDVPVNYREKFRVSYKFRFFRMDFTIVSSYKDINTNNSREILYEIEFEFEEIKNFMTKDNKSYEDFKMMFLRFIQNIFCIYELISPEYYIAFKASRIRSELDPIFGDYLEKNLF